MRTLFVSAFGAQKNRRAFIPGLIFLIALNACQIARSPTQKYVASELSTPIIERFDFNLFFSGKSKLNKNNRTDSASIEIQLNTDALLIGFFGPFGRLAYQIYADKQTLSLIDYNSMRSEIYPNTPKNRIKLTGTDFTFSELMTVFTARLPRHDRHKWKIEYKNDVFKTLQYTPNKGDANEMAIIRYESYKIYHGFNFPKKIIVDDRRFNFHALFVPNDIALGKKKDIAFPNLPESFEYIEYAK